MKGKAIICCIILVAFVFLFPLITGWVHIHHCATEPTLPVWCIINSCLPAVFLLVTILGQSDQPCQRQLLLLFGGIFVAWLIAGHVWIISTFEARERHCESTVLGASVFVLVLGWLMVFYMLYLSILESNGDELNLPVIYTVILLLTVVMFAPKRLRRTHTRIIKEYRQDLPYPSCNVQPFLPAWTTVSACTPMLLMAFVFAIRCSEFFVQLVTVIAYFIYLGVFLAGSVVIFHVYIMRNPSCNTRIRGFSIFVFAMSLVMLVIATYVLIVEALKFYPNWLKRLDSLWPDTVVDSDIEGFIETKPPEDKQYMTSQKEVDYKAERQPLLQQAVQRNDAVKQRAPVHRRAKTRKKPLTTKDWLLKKSQESVRTPSYWTIFTSSFTVQELMLNCGTSRKFLRVDVDERITNSIKRLINGASFNKARPQINVLNVQRLENLPVYEKYARQRQGLFLDAWKGSPMPRLQTLSESSGNVSTDTYLSPSMRKDIHPVINECFLFHGSAWNKVDSICSQGLDLRVCSNYSRFGKAIYLAENPLKADQYAGVQQSQGTELRKAMFLVRTCLGNIHLMRKGSVLRRPPCTKPGCLDDACGHVTRFDSVVANGCSSYREFMIFDNSQTYPEYLITYVVG